MAFPPDVEIQGFHRAPFAAVREAFERNFERRGEHGAAVAVVHDGELVVDLWGGWCDAERTRPWQRDTLVSTQSTTKGLVAVLFHWLVERGALAWDEPVSTYWPAFARNGKEAITVRTLISHQAGLCVVDEPLAPGAALQWSRVVRALEAQAPVWVPGERFGYHAVTWAFLLGELAARAGGEPLPALFARAFARPWKLDFHFGLAPGEFQRTAELLPLPAGRSTLPPGSPTPLRERAFRICPPLPGVGPNSPRVRQAPGNGYGNARGIARFYGGLAAGGILDGERCLGEATVATLGETEVVGEDAVLGTQRRFGRGFWLHYPTRNAVRGARSYGHPGLGGSFGFADPDRRIGVGYTMNLPGAYLRAANLELALYRCL